MFDFFFIWVDLPTCPREKEIDKIILKGIWFRDEELRNSNEEFY